MSELLPATKEESPTLPHHVLRGRDPASCRRDSLCSGEWKSLWPTGEGTPRRVRPGGQIPVRAIPYQTDVRDRDTLGSDPTDRHPGEKQSGQMPQTHRYDTEQGRRSARYATRSSARPAYIAEGFRLARLLRQWFASRRWPPDTLWRLETGMF